MRFTLHIKRVGDSNESAWLEDYKEDETVDEDLDDEDDDES